MLCTVLNESSEISKQVEKKLIKNPNWREACLEVDLLPVNGEGDFVRKTGSFCHFVLLTCSILKKYIEARYHD